MDLPRMPIGKFAGLPISDMRSTLLLWWSSQDTLRQNYPDTVRAILAELRQRFAQPERIELELLPDYCDLA